MDVLIWMFVAFLVMVVVSITTVLLVLRAVYRRIRRSRMLAGRALRARARLTAGPRRKVLRLRVRLADALSSGQAAVELAGHADGPRGELDRLFARIHREGEGLDRQLRLLESETDPAVLIDELAAGERRVDHVERMVRRLRSAVGAGLAGLTDDTLGALRDEVDREAAALHAGVQELRALNGRDHLDGPSPHESAHRLNRSK